MGDKNQGIRVEGSGARDKVLGIRHDAWEKRDQGWGMRDKGFSSAFIEIKNLSKAEHFPP